MSVFSVMRALVFWPNFTKSEILTFRAKLAAEIIFIFDNFLSKKRPKIGHFGGQKRGLAKKKIPPAKTIKTAHIAFFRESKRPSKQIKIANKTDATWKQQDIERPSGANPTTLLSNTNHPIIKKSFLKKKIRFFSKVKKIEK